MTMLKKRLYLRRFLASQIIKLNRLFVNVTILKLTRISFLMKLRFTLFDDSAHKTYLHFSVFSLNAGKWAHFLRSKMLIKFDLNFMQALSVCLIEPFEKKFQRLLRINFLNRTLERTFFRLFRKKSLVPLEGTFQSFQKELFQTFQKKVFGSFKRSLLVFLERTFQTFQKNVFGSFRRNFLVFLERTF